VKQLLLLFLICISFSSLAQETVELKGQILNEYQIIEGVIVVNLRNRQATITNALGEFEMVVSKGDTLEIKAIHFKKEQVVVSQKIFDDKTYKVFMISNVNELDEVRLSNSILSGNLDKDSESIVFNPPEINDFANSPEPISAERRRLHTATSKFTSNPLAVSVDRIINAFSGKTKLLRKHIEVSEYDLEIKKIRSYYADKVFVESLRIPLDYINDFLTYLFKDVTYLDEISDLNKLELLHYLEKRSPDYLKAIEGENYAVEKD